MILVPQAVAEAVEVQPDLTAMVRQLRDLVVLVVVVMPVQVVQAVLLSQVPAVRV